MNSTLTADMPRVPRKAGASALATTSSKGGGAAFLNGAAPDNVYARALAPWRYSDLSANTLCYPDFKYEYTANTQQLTYNSMRWVNQDGTIGFVGDQNGYGLGAFGDQTASGMFIEGTDSAFDMSWCYSGAYAVYQGDVPNWRGTSFTTRDAFKPVVLDLDINTHWFNTAGGEMFAIGFGGNGEIGDQGAVNRTYAWRRCDNGGGMYNNDANGKARRVVMTAHTGTNNNSTGRSVYALTHDGRLWAWGMNNYGQCAQNHLTQVNYPSQAYRIGIAARGESVGAAYQVTDAVYICATGDNCGVCYYIDSLGKLWGCGHYTGNNFGAGWSTHQQMFVPIEHSGYGNNALNAEWVTKVQCGDTAADTGVACMGLTKSGRVFTWGYMRANVGNIGDGNTGAGGYNVRYLDAYLPSTATDPMTNIWMIGGNYPSCYARSKLGRFFAWGYNAYGQLGTSNDTTNRLTPTEANYGWLLPDTGKTYPDIVKLIGMGTGSYANVMVLTRDGRVMMAGSNNVLQMGYLNAYTSHGYFWTPGLPFGRKVADIGAYGYAQYGTFGAILEDGSLYSWGNNTGYAAGHWQWTGGAFTANHLLPRRLV